MRLYIVSVIKSNHQHDGYMGVDGYNTHVLIDDDNRVIADYTSTVSWQGSGSPYPTPPGGPWECEYIENHPKFGRCLKVLSDREGDIFIHLAERKSFGCMIVNPTLQGNQLYARIMENAGGFVIFHEVSDDRSDEDKAAFPIDYKSMGHIS